MAGYFLDTSALTKYYHREIGTDVVESLFEGSSSILFISRLATLELQSVFARKVRTRELEEGAFHLLRKRLVADIVERKLVVVRMTDDHYQAAQSLVLKHATVHSLRTLDALQLAVAVDLQMAGLLDHFVCSDIQLCRVAALEKLTVTNPEIV